MIPNPQRERVSLICLALLMAPALQPGERMSVLLTAPPSKLGQKMMFMKGNWVTVAKSTKGPCSGFAEIPNLHHRVCSIYSHKNDKA